MTYTFSECPDDSDYECYQCGANTGGDCDNGLCYNCNEENEESEE